MTASCRLAHSGGCPECYMHLHAPPCSPPYLCSILTLALLSSWMLAVTSQLTRIMRCAKRQVDRVSSIWLPSPHLRAHHHQCVMCDHM